MDHHSNPDHGFSGMADVGGPPTPVGHPGGLGGYVPSNGHIANGTSATTSFHGAPPDTNPDVFKGPKPTTGGGPGGQTDASYGGSSGSGTGVAGTVDTNTLPAETGPYVYHGAAGDNPSDFTGPKSTTGGPPGGQTDSSVGANRFFRPNTATSGSGSVGAPSTEGTFTGGPGPGGPPKPLDIGPPSQVKPAVAPRSTEGSLRGSTSTGATGKQNQVLGPPTATKATPPNNQALGPPTATKPGAAFLGPPVKKPKRGRMKPKGRAV